VYEVELVVAFIFLNNLVLIHIEGDGEVTLQREVRVFDVSAVNFLVFVQQVRVLEFLNWLVNNRRDPIVNAQSSIFNNHFLEIVKFITLIIIGLQILYKLSNMLFGIHDLIRLLKFDCLNHHFSSATFFDNKKLKQIILVDLMNQLVDFNITHHMLSLTPTCQVYKPITMSLALVTQLIIYSINICLFEKSLRTRSHLLSSLSLNGSLRNCL
jgi:hypothetical protein